MSETCPSLSACPIYSGILQGKSMTSKAYRQFFCESDFKTCKRYLVKQAVGKCPPDLLPNTTMSVEEIIKEFHLVGLQ